MQETLQSIEGSPHDSNDLKEGALLKTDQILQQVLHCCFTFKEKNNDHYV